MPTILKEKAIWFNDVVLVPSLGVVKSRKQINKEYNRFICSCMTAVVGPTFAKTATDLGLTVCIPRFLGVEKEIEIYNNCTNKDNLYFSTGLNDLRRATEFGKTGCENFLIDIASGYLPHIEETVKMLSDNTAIKNIILGNVTTTAGFYHLSSIADKYNLNCIIRCGLSNGSGCETYSTTGIGSGQLSELMELYPLKTGLKKQQGDFLSVSLASDGGLKDSGYVCKAFLAGSDYVFIGGLFAKALEAECHISGDSTYYGLASDKNQILSTGNKFRHSEGREYKIDNSKLKPLKDIIEELWGCVSSAVSYSGHDSLTKAIGNGVFQIKQNSLPPRNR